MSGEQDHWLRQKREIQAYNTFFRIVRTCKPVSRCARF